MGGRYGKKRFKKVIENDNNMKRYWDEAFDILRTPALRSPINVIMKPAYSVLVDYSDTEYAGTTAPQCRAISFICFACLP